MPRDSFRVRPSNLFQTCCVPGRNDGGSTRCGVSCWTIGARFRPRWHQTLRDLGQFLPAICWVSAPSRCATTSHRLWRWSLTVRSRSYLCLHQICVDRDEADGYGSVPPRHSVPRVAFSCRMLIILNKRQQNVSTSLRHEYSDEWLRQKGPAWRGFFFLGDASPAAGAWGPFRCDKPGRWARSCLLPRSISPWMTLCHNYYYTTQSQENRITW
jgi:hypothetical protein